MRELQLLALYRSHHSLDWKWVISLDDAQPEMAYAAFISANSPKAILYVLRRCPTLDPSTLNKSADGLLKELINFQ